LAGRTLRKRQRSRGAVRGERKTMPQTFIEWAIFIAAGIALGLVLFFGLSS
jgi:hypothetical protein